MHRVNSSKNEVNEKILKETVTLENVIYIEPRCEKVCKFKTNQLKNTDAIILAQEIEKVRIPNALVKINQNGEFLITVLNANAIPKIVHFNNLKFEPYISDINTLPAEKSLLNLNVTRETEIANLLRTSHMNEEEKELIINICQEFSDIFYLEGDKLTFTSEIKHTINTKDSAPIYTKSYRYPYIHKEEVKSQISKMLDQGIIKPSISPWSSPVWIVPKKMDASGKQKWRVVIDFRRLNEVSVDDKYPLPNIADLLDQLGHCQYFTTLDLASGFHQIEVDPKDTEKTAFSVENGHYEFLRMPFGLKNAPSTFQRIMDSILLGIQNERCAVYMDDILIYSRTIHEHLSRLREVFTRLRKANLKIQPDKCEFLKKEVAYLGHLITPDGVKPDPKKVEAVENFPVPKNTKEVKSFLGLTGYYRRFIPSYAKISKPLTNLLKKDQLFNFNQECNEAFNILKNYLITEPILQYPRFDEPFILTTDASLYAIGAVLSQGPIGKDLPIAYASRTLCSAETKYSVIERELLAIVWAVKHFRPYLYGRKFVLVCDHRPLTWVFSIKDPGSRLARWRLKLEEYDYEIKYKPGKINKNADALSRIKINHSQQIVALNKEIQEQEESSEDIDDLEISLMSPQTMENEFQRFGNLYQTTSLIDYSKIRYSNEQLLDKEHKNIIIIFQQDKLTDLHDKIMEDFQEEHPSFNMDKITVLNSKSVRKRNYYIILLPFLLQDAIPTLFKILANSQTDIVPSKTYYVENNVEIPLLEMLCFIFADKDLKIVICQNIVITPEEDQIPIIIDQYHSGKRNFHRGVNETIRRIKEKYNWTNLIKDVENYIKKCENCQKNKILRKNLTNPLVITETPKTAFERINIDILEIPDKNYVLTIMDELTKFIQAYPISDKSSKSVVNTLLLYFQHYGTPLRIHSDSGKEFTNQLMKDLCNLYDIKLTCSSVNHPQSNGSLERFHATLLEMIRVMNTEDPRAHPCQLLPYACICYNNSVNKTTGFTPYELTFGHTSSRPPETLYSEKEIISKYIRDLNARIKHYYKVAREKTLLQKQKAKERFDQTKAKKNKDNTEYKVGDKVYVKESQIKTKLAPKFNGPFLIKEICLNSAILENLQTKQTTKVNFDRLKPYYDDIIIKPDDKTAIETDSD